MILALERSGAGYELSGMESDIRRSRMRLAWVKQAPFEH